MGIRQSRDVERHLPHLQKGYTAVSGSPFKHFYCPILQADEETELCMGHIVNESIPNSCRKCVVQRKDVDGFYGSVVEADFATLIQAMGKGLLESVFDPVLSKKVRSKFMLNGKECRYHTYVGDEPAPTQSAVLLDNGEGGERRIVLHMPPDAVTAAQDQDWQLVVEGDHRIPAIASLIKAAYLTLFRLLGYKYALSLAGRYVGLDILGKFFLDNRHKPPAEAKKAAQAYFAQFAPMVRPIEGYSGTPPLGTIEDRQVKACFSSSSREAFGIVVCVRTDRALNAVMMPAFTRADSVAAYFEFLKNDRETIYLEHCQYDAEKDGWAGTGEPVEMRWPKDKESFEIP
jgi:hypothetical protein